MPTHALNVPTIGNMGKMFQIYNNTKYVQPVGIQPSGMPGAKKLNAVGGKTLLWAAFAPRMFTPDLEKWPISISEMNGYYNIAEEFMQVNQEYSEGSYFTDIVLKRLRGYGFIEAERIPFATNLQASHDGLLNSTVFFSSINFLAASLNVRSIDIAIKAHAAKVVFNQGKTVGVEVKGPDKKAYFIRAKTVVLSAGAFESPRILLNSGLSGSIGHYLVSHSSVGATGVFDRSQFPEDLGVLSILIPQSRGNPFQLHLIGPGPYSAYQFEVQPLQNNLISSINAYGVVEPKFENRVSLDPNVHDEYGIPKLQIHFNYSERDYAVINQMAQKLMHAAGTAGMRLLPQNDPQKQITLAPPGSDNHQSGTCRMGVDPSQSVTNPYGEVFGVNGLFVADNSVLPTLPAANPTLTTIALAIRTADYMTRRYS